MKPIVPLNDLLGRVNTFHAQKVAMEQGHMPPEKDPQETTSPAVKKDDGDVASKQQLPDKVLSTSNTDGSSENNIPGTGDKGEASGDAPGVSDTTSVTADNSQQKQDEAVDNPVTAKIAGNGMNLAAGIAARLKAAGLGGGQATATQPATTAQPAGDKTAGQTPSADSVASDIQMDAGVYAKIASLVMKYDEGRQLVNNLAEREIGKEAALNLLAEAAQVEAQQLQAAEHQQKFASAVQKLASTATEDDISDIQRLSAVHVAGLSKCATDREKIAYMAGAEQAAGAMDSPDGMIPGEAGDQPPSMEEIANAVMALLEEGAIDPQTAEQILAMLGGAGGGAEAGGEEAALAAAAGGGEAAVPPAEVVGEEKAASIKTRVDNLSIVDQAVAHLFPETK